MVPQSWDNDRSESELEILKKYWSDPNPKVSNFSDPIQIRSEICKFLASDPIPIRTAHQIENLYFCDIAIY